MKEEARGKRKTRKTKDERLLYDYLLLLLLLTCTNGMMRMMYVYF